MASTRIRITATEADELLTAIQGKLKEVALESVLVIDEKATPRVRYDIASIIREAVMESEDKRLEAGRAKKGEAKG